MDLLLKKDRNRQEMLIFPNNLEIGELLWNLILNYLQVFEKKFEERFGIVRINAWKVSFTTQ